MNKKLLTLLICATLALGGAGIAACKNNEQPPEPTVVLKTEENSAEIDIYQVTYAVVDIPSLFKTLPEGAEFSVKSDSEHVIAGNVNNAGKVNVISDGTVGTYSLTVTVTADGKEVYNFNVSIIVKDNAPAPVVKKQIEDINFNAPVFPSSQQTYVEYKLDLSEYFDAASNITYTATCEDSTVTMTADEINPYIVTLVFRSFGEKQIKIGAVQNGVEKASSSFNAKLAAATPAQLINGGFEQGLTGWNLDSWARAAYTVYDSNVDIWGNGIDNDGKYLYGYHNEAGVCEFTSSVFTLGGNGYITWKMAGNCTDDLQFILMKYVDDGEDVEIAKFNNWYYGAYAGSGFIFREYYYQVASEYIGSKCYFKVVDNLTSDFAFVNLDSIVTNYTTVPSIGSMYRAGYCKDPDGVILDMSDTSQTPFPSDLSSVGFALENGDFENGYTGWYMTSAEKRAYSIYGSKTDIWNNQVNATNNYLYGYANEAFASANFHSSLFKVGGCGLITWKMAGNSTADLQFILMQYNPDGDDVEIAKFNNWYFPVSNQSGFIFRNYYYQIDLEAYEGSYMYFVVKDYKADNFGFICLDDIVTYYETRPTLAGEWFKAGYVTDPDAASPASMPALLKKEY